MPRAADDGAITGRTRESASVPSVYPCPSPFDGGLSWGCGGPASTLPSSLPRHHRHPSLEQLVWQDGGRRPKHRVLPSTPLTPPCPARQIANPTTPRSEGVLHLCWLLARGLAEVGTGAPPPLPSLPPNTQNKCSQGSCLRPFGLCFPGRLPEESLEFFHLLLGCSQGLSLRDNFLELVGRREVVCEGRRGHDPGEDRSVAVTSAAVPPSAEPSSSTAFSKPSSASTPEVSCLSLLPVFPPPPSRSLSKSGQDETKQQGWRTRVKRRVGEWGVSA